MPRVPLGVQEKRTKTRILPETTTATTARRAGTAESLRLNALPKKGNLNQVGRLS
jgi:hypothetical protein